MAGETVQQPAIGYSITANIGGERQIVFQHFVGADENDAQVHKALDRINKLIDRMRSQYSLPDLKAERDKYLAEIAQYEEDVAVAQSNHDVAQASLDVQIEEAGRTAKTIFDDSYAEHVKSGRQGEYKPKGQTKMQLDRADAAVREAVAAKVKNDAERQQFLDNVGASIEVRRKNVAILNEKIADAEKAIT